MQLSLAERVIIGAYVGIVIILIYLSFNFEGSVNDPWIFILFGFTLPWSIIAWVFIWAIIHGSDVGIFVFLFIIFGVANAFCIHWIWMLCHKKNHRIPN